MRARRNFLSRRADLVRARPVAELAEIATRADAEVVRHRPALDFSGDALRDVGQTSDDLGMELGDHIEDRRDALVELGDVDRTGRMLQVDEVSDHTLELEVEPCMEEEGVCRQLETM